MPNTHTTLTSLFSDIADAIRGKTGSSATIVADNFPTAIANIPTGGGSATIEPLSVTTNGTYTAPTGVDGYSPITVNVPSSGVTTMEEPNSTGTTLYINSTGGSSWVRPYDWPDLSQMDVSGGNILYITSYADEARGFCSFQVTCTGSYTVEVGTISSSTFTVESTQTFSSGSYCRLYYGSANGTYKVLRVTGTAIKTFTANGSSAITIDTFHKHERSQGIIDIVGKLPSCTSFKCSTYYLINVEVSNLALNGSMSSMFNGCCSLTNLNVSSWDTSGVTNMGSMFSGCYSLTNLNVSSWDTSGVTNMNSMFSNCCSLTNLDLSSWDTSSVTNMSSMFSQCNSLTSLNLGGWDTSSITTMGSMFNSCYSLASLNLGGWDTSSVTNMNQMFYFCYSLTSLNISGWDISSVTDMGNMFSNCYLLTNLDLSSWDTSSVTNMSSMFSNCYLLTNLDISSWDTSLVTNMVSIFYSCYSLTSLDLSEWDFSSITATSSTNSMFSNCYGLHGSLTFPSSLTYVGTSCFANCRSIYEWHFLATTPPTLANTNAFGNMSDYGGKKIYVPAESLEAYKTATNWSTYASYMVGE